MSNPLSEVTYEEIQGYRGIAVERGVLFLAVKREGAKWKIRLFDIFEGMTPITGWITLKDVEELRKTKILKDNLRNKYKDYRERIELAISIIQDNIEEWNLEEKLDKNLEIDKETEDRINEEVRRILQSNNQLEALKPHLDVVIVYEDMNKQVALVLLLGSKYKEAKYKQILIFKGASGGGKTTLASTLARLFKTKEVGRFTEHALEYSDVKDFEVLYIKELGFMDEEKQGVIPIKFISSDDKGFVVEYTIREENGRFRTEQRHIPPITIVSTTTRLVLDNQFERRSWLLNVDESEEQTERIKRWKALKRKQEDEVKLGLRKITDYDFSCEVIKRVISKIKPKKIVIPFPESIAEILPSKELRVRGDIEKLFVFIELYALLNIKRLWKLKDDVYAVTPEVAMEAIKLAEKPLTNMLQGGDERIKPLIKAMKELRLEKGSDIDKNIRETIAVKLGKSEETIRLYLNRLEKEGFLSSDDTKPKTYTLLYPLETLERELCETSLISKDSDDFRIKMEKEAQNWLNSLSLKPTAEESEIFQGENHPKIEELTKIQQPNVNSMRNKEENLKYHCEDCVNFIPYAQLCKAYPERVVVLFSAEYPSVCPFFKLKKVNLKNE